jgi:rhodanese-related sulfurtransferase
MLKTILQAICIVLLASATGLVLNAVRPEATRLAYVTPPKPELKEEEIISLDEAQQLWGADGVFLDARPRADYERGHIPNAFHVPPEDFAQAYAQVAPMLGPDTPIICYCDGEECDLSHKLADQLRRQGHENVRILVNGWTVWNRAGLPTQSAADMEFDQP